MQAINIEGGVCAAQGFTANGLNCGLTRIKQRMIWGWYTVKGCLLATAVYTTNKVKAPVLVTKRHLGMSGEEPKTVIVNSKNANCNADGG